MLIALCHLWTAGLLAQAFACLPTLEKSPSADLNDLVGLEQRGGGYFDAQQLADFIMNSEFPGYDGANTTPATSDSTFNHMHNIAASFPGAPDDYESYDNARARKRRMTASDERRASGSFSGFTLPDTSNGLFCMLDQQHSGFVGSAQQQGYGSSGSMLHSAGLSSLPAPPDSGNSSLSTGYSANPSTDSSTGSVGLVQQTASFFSGGSYNGVDGMTSQSMMLGSPSSNSSRPVNGRKHQSLSISVGRTSHNEFGGSSQEPPTPGMFSPSFMDAMEGAAAAAAVAAAVSMSSPPMVYNVASPYTPGHSHNATHHNGFPVPCSGTQQQHHQHQQGQSTAEFLHGAANTAIDAENSTISPGSTAMSSTLNATMLRSNTVGSSVSGGFGSAEDFTAGLHINMNAAAVAAMGSSYDDGASNAGAGSAFSRVQDAGDMSQLLCSSGSMPGQTIAGMDLTMGSSFAPFTNIPGLEQFSPNPWDRQNLFLNTGAAINNGDIGSSYGMMTTDPSLLHSMDGSVMLHDGSASDNSRFSLACGPAATLGAISAVGCDVSIASPLASAKNTKPRSPVAIPKRSRKRAATVANIHSQDSQQSISSGALDARSANYASKDTPSTHSRSSSATAAYTGPVFNSQAVVKGTGSKVMMVLTSKVAQKSYGTEKRFLCPPPTILMFGTSWQLPTLNSNDGSVQTTNGGSDMNSAMPRISVSVTSSDTSGQGGDSDYMNDAGACTRRLSVSGSSVESRTCQLEWLSQPELTPKPKAHVPHNPVPPVRPPQEGEPVTGRYVAKQLFINDVDEKRKKVSVKVRVHDPSGKLMLNEFDSRPIKVISKPSKKRQSVKNVDLCIHHGSTVSLFNRLRSQTVSTKYLGVTRSMSVGGPRPFWFPALSDESKAAMQQPGSDGRTPGPANNTTFVARNAVWDPFIIWIVNTHLDQKEIDAFNARITENPTPVPGYPTPPTFALHPQCPPDFDSGNSNVDEHGLGGSCGSSINGDIAGQPQPRAPIPILYNQPVILQCVSTGMCSPVLTLRKVEKGSLAVGCFYGRDHSRDVLGDPVSQLHKVAFEVRVQTLEELPAVTVTPAGLNTRVGSYLTCMGDVVGLNSTCDGRQLTSDASSGSKSSGGSRAAAAAPVQGRKQAKDSASVGTTSWAEDVGDNAVWTVVGTDCAIYRFDYPDESEIVESLQKPVSVYNNRNASNASASAAATGSVLPHASLNLPPTPTSPHGVQDYSHQAHQQDSGFSLDMMLASQNTTGVSSGANAEFHGTGSLDASFAAAMYGMSVPPGMGDNLASHLLSSSPQMIQSTAAVDTATLFDSIGNSGNSSNANMVGHPGNVSADQMSSPVAGDSLIPIVFKSSVQHPPAISPLCRDASNNGGGMQSVTERAVITMQGLNFTPDMVMLFDGKASLYTEFKSSDGIACLGPLPSEFADVLAQKAGAEDDECAGSRHDAINQSNGNKQHLSSPSISDSSLSLHHSSSDETAASFVQLDQNDSPRTHRASSAESTASSTNSTLNSSSSSSTSSEKAGKNNGGSNSRVLAKGTKRMLKIPIYLSRNGGAGPTFKTGQFYTMHF
ncbi:hypothetical protein IW140_000218 [Coemansia sp. RSA 1813]|nr:hypothetical protein LPJ74_000352 [Coemansia sp. RSA 1843]KAJ2217982.1 hypothetical protein EV179_000127 [Coemansia sp. RSA 487]KAJ2573175.1 hypothetical protein IW140_000218 [Coemansia sp. RSA 1813]